MKKNFLKASSLALSMLMLVACGEQKGEARAEEIYEEHADHEVMKEETHENLNTAEEVRVFSDPAQTLQAQTSSLLNDYMAIKNALVESSTEGANEAASELLQNAEGFSASDVPEEQQSFYEEQVDELELHLRKMVQEKSIDKQRDHFAVVTREMYELSKAFNPTEETIYYQYCPMAFNNNGGYWLSAQEEIRNPYFGDKMLKCGRVEETL